MRVSSLSVVSSRKVVYTFKWNAFIRLSLFRDTCIDIFNHIWIKGLWNRLRNQIWPQSNHNQTPRTPCNQTTYTCCRRLVLLVYFSIQVMIIPRKQTYRCLHLAVLLSCNAIPLITILEFTTTTAATYHFHHIHTSIPYNDLVGFPFIRLSGLINSTRLGTLGSS